MTTQSNQQSEEAPGSETSIDFANRSCAINQNSSNREKAETGDFSPGAQTGSKSMQSIAVDSTLKTRERLERFKALKARAVSLL
jgi:hypothetical protein